MAYILEIPPAKLQEHFVRTLLSTPAINGAKLADFQGQEVRFFYTNKAIDVAFNARIEIRNGIPLICNDNASAMITLRSPGYRITQIAEPPLPIKKEFPHLKAYIYLENI